MPIGGLPHSVCGVSRESPKMSLPFSSPVRVLVVDDHPVVRDGLRSLLSHYAEVEIVGEAADSFTALERSSVLKPDVILLDIKLADENGLVLARRILHAQPDSRIIILTSYDDEDTLLEAAKIGVHGYLLKDASSDVLKDTICAVRRGEKRLSPAMVACALGQVQDLARELMLLRSGISAEDLAVLQLIADGAAVAEIAEVLHFSERSVKRKIQDILEKLQVNTRAQAVAEAYNRGLL